MALEVLEEWNINTLTDLLTKGYFESEEFDFKERLPHNSDEAGKARLVKTCCAFANSGGGFLIFGVSNNTSLPVQNRLVGIDPTVDFPEHFGSYPQKCMPTVQWDFKNPPISLASGNVIHIIHIPQSWSAPHSFEVANDGRYFAKRTNKGNEPMSYEEIRMAFLQYYEKRLKLQLLRTELQIIQDNAVRLTRSGESVSNPPPLGEFSLTILETTLADTYTILVNNALLLNDLTTIRKLCGQVNNKLQSILPVYHMPMTDAIKSVFIKHNTDVTNFCQSISSTTHLALQALDEIISKK